MAVAIRCCASSPPDLFASQKSRLSGKLPCALFKADKLALLTSRDASTIPSISWQKFLGRHPKHLLDRHQDTFLKLLSAHQERTFLRSSAIALVTNAFMTAAPPEAMAQTCEADNSFLNMPVLLLVALVGATVGGLLARQRRGELKRLNEQLRQINAALRRQAKIESYAPNLSYAPVGSRITDEVIVDSRKQELISRLRTGKNYLRNQDPQKAFEEFKTALSLAQDLKDPTEEKKAARGLGASLQRQGQYREAIKYHLMVLDVSKREGDESGNTEAYGAIADCYTELGDLEQAGKFYDHYIARLETD
ncbi:Protein FLUORESCENT IN BLUE LIGHT, chloroplastic [Linum perenne]